MTEQKNIPEATVRRFSLYLRELEKIKDNGDISIKSKDLGQRLGLSDVLVRKDFGFLGIFGRSGVGYEISALLKELQLRLHKGKKIATIVIGAGKIGQAICSYSQFIDRGFQIVDVFDKEKKTIGSVVASHKVKDIKNIKDVCQKKKVQLAVLAVPPESARKVALLLVQSGVLGILNFAPTHLDLPSEVAVVNVDFSLALDELSFAVFQER